jgi:chromosome condensin MukBEF complex kleisin-like MukF subunit
LKDLRNDLKAKEDRIIKLTSIEGELKGKDKGKDELIATLNANIDKFQQQLVALRDCQNHENPLQSVVDTLTAKNLELEA